MLQKNFTLLLALVSTAWAVPVRREVPQEHSHEQFLTIVNKFLKIDNPDGIVDAVFALLGNAAAQQGLGKIADPTCLQLATADRAFTNAKAAGDVQGQVGSLIYRALERNTGRVGLASDACTSIKAVNPEIAAISQHQDPASANAAQINKAITLELAKQIQAVGGDPLDALKAGTFAPGNLNDATGKGNSCDDLGDPVGCIFTKNLLVPDASEAEILAAVGGAADAATTSASSATSATSTLVESTSQATSTTQSSSASEASSTSASETSASASVETSASASTSVETTSASETSASASVETTSASETSASTSVETASSETTTSAAETAAETSTRRAHTRTRTRTRARHTRTRTATLTQTATSTATESGTATETASSTVSASESASTSETATGTESASTSETATGTESASTSETATGTESASTISQTATGTISQTASSTETASGTVSQSATESTTQSSSASASSTSSAASPSATSSVDKNLQTYSGHVGDVVAPEVVKAVRGFLVDGQLVQTLTAALAKSCDLQQTLCTGSINTTIGRILDVTEDKCAEQNAACRDLAAKAGA